MVDTIATVDTNGNTVTAIVSNDTSAIGGGGSLFLASTNLANPATVQSISDIGNVDVSTNGIDNGSILVYKTATNMWTSTTTLDAQHMEGGEF